MASHAYTRTTRRRTVDDHARAGRGGIPTPQRFSVPGTEIPDYYEFLEISPQATQETIHRVYRFLAAR